MNKSTWNSLEIAKIVTAIAVTVSVALLTFRLQGVGESTKRIAGKQAEIYHDVGPKLNNLISYYFYVGRWKEKGPAEMISVKRQLDDIVFSNQLYFSTEFFAKYNQLINTFFKTGTNWGEDAKLNTTSNHREPIGIDESEFKPRFTEVDLRDELCKHYGELLAQMAIDLGIGTRNNANCPPIYRL